MDTQDLSQFHEPSLKFARACSKVWFRTGRLKTITKIITGTDLSIYVNDDQNENIGRLLFKT
jgi:hypothetical protein